MTSKTESEYTAHKKFYVSCSSENYTMSIKF